MRNPHEPLAAAALLTVWHPSHTCNAPPSCHRQQRPHHRHPQLSLPAHGPALDLQQLPATVQIAHVLLAAITAVTCVVLAATTRRPCVACPPPSFTPVNGVLGDGKKIGEEEKRRYERSFTLAQIQPRRQSFFFGASFAGLPLCSWQQPQRGRSWPLTLVNMGQILVNTSISTISVTSCFCCIWASSFWVFP